MGLLKRLFVFLLILFILGFISYYLSNLNGKVSFSSSSDFVIEKVIVNSIIDGDTIIVSGSDLGNKIHVRLLGINTPEKKKPYYFEAKEFLSKEIENKTVELVQDGSDKDKYGRRLRYVFYNHRLINVEIVENGLATTFMLDSLKYKDKFLIAENFSRKSELKLWRKSSEQCSACIKLIKLEPKEEYFIIKNNCDFNCELKNWEIKDDANHFFSLLSLDAKSERVYYSSIDEAKKTKEVWNNDHDRFFIRDSFGELILFYSY